MVEIPTLFALVMSLLASSEVDLSVEAEQEQREDVTRHRVKLNFHHTPTGYRHDELATGRTVAIACNAAWRGLMDVLRVQSPELYHLLANAMALAMQQTAKGG